MAVLEPFYKVVTDGSLGVRVDNPREVVWLDDIGPSDVDGWRAEGAQTVQNCWIAMQRLKTRVEMGCNGRILTASTRWCGWTMAAPATRMAGGRRVRGG